MKLTGLVRTSLLLSLLGTTAMIYAQDQRDDAKPPQEEPRPEATKPAGDEVKPPRAQEDVKPQEAKPKEDAKPAKQDDVKPSQSENKPGNQEDAKPSKQAEQQDKSSEHVQQAGGQRGGHIPDDKFRANFGRQHMVVINQPTIVEGQPRFQYGGYWFNIVDAWPAGWAYTDQCYIDYVDGEYFLFDLLHPGVRVALFVVI
jgi:hypothetical protein